MQRTHVLGLAAGLALVAACALFFLRGGNTPPPPTPGSDPVATPVAAPSTGAAPAPSAEPVDAGARREVTIASGAATLDPEVRAALSGFRGRVVDPRKQAVAGCGVRIYRGALDAITPPDVDLFADATTYAPEFIAGDTKTGSDGEFLCTGVWPRGFYLLLAGIGTDAPTHRFLSQSPGPGEIVDLGDIVLADAGVLTGIVVDEDDHPIAGALVRAADLPALVTTFFPFERVDPDSCFLMHQQDTKQMVVELPAWCKRVYDELPLPKTRSDASGAFRLVGVVPGNNLLATTQHGYLSEVKPGLTIKPGEVRDVGKVKLKRGEELSGSVVDTDGKPIAGAEVIAGSVSMSAPVDVAARIGTTDAQGAFHAEGFTTGNVSVAARRTPRDPWTMVPAVPIRKEVVVTLPAQYAIVVRVTDPTGAPVATPKLKLMAGERDSEALAMATLGFAAGVDLHDRVTHTEDGRHRIERVPPGHYMLLAGAEGCGNATAAVHIERGDVEAVVQLTARIEYTVRVLGPDETPIRSAGIWVEEAGDGKVREMPFMVGRTGSDGRLVITQTSASRIRVTADHPRWGAVHSEVARGAGELVLRMQTPGKLEGTLLDHGKPVALGKYTVAIDRRSGGGGALEDTPLLTTPRLDGAFHFLALQPGRYHTGVINSLEALTSPGGAMTLMQSMFMSNELPEQDVEIAAGQTATVQIDVAKAEYTGPSARLFGSVTIDGRAGVGSTVMLWTEAGRRAAKVDESGRFDIAKVPVGNLQVNVTDSGDAAMFGNRGLWSQQLQLKEGEERELRIDFATTSIRGTVVRPDGKPAAKLWVQSRSRALDGKPGDEDWNGAQTDQEGNFELPRVRAGIYRFEVSTGDDENGLRGKLENVRADGVTPLTGVRLELHAAIVVSGRVDLSVLSKKPEWIGLEFGRFDPAHPDHFEGGNWTQIDETEGTFRTNELDPGTWAVRLHVEGQEWVIHDHIEVGAQGARNLFFRPVPKTAEPKQRR